MRNVFRVVFSMFLIRKYMTRRKLVVALKKLFLDYPKCK